MADDLIPADVREFVLQHIDSIAHLEALLLLMRQPEERWSAGRVAGHLYLELAQAEEVLAQLCAQNLLDCRDDVYWFDVKWPGQKQVIERLATLYAQHLIPITNLVHAKPSGARAFAAAFKLRRER